MEKHPIENIMTTTMQSIREMVDVNTVIGDPIPGANGATVVPISRVSFGFAAGGGEYACSCKEGAISAQGACGLPFAGGAGAGVTVQPVGFLVLDKDQARLLPAQYQAPLDHILECVPQLITEARKLCQKKQPEPTA